MKYMRRVKAVHCLQSRFTAAMRYNVGLTLDQDGTPYIAFTNNSKVFVMNLDSTDGNWKYIDNIIYTSSSPSDIQLKMDNGVLYLTYQYNYNGYRAAVMKYIEENSWTSLGDVKAILAIITGKG